MYIPTNFKAKDFTAVQAFVSKYPFAILVSTIEDTPIATHIPVILEIDGETWTFFGHVSKANIHHKLFNQGKHLLIFQEPHAYISPSLYENIQNVPTWNYISVHCYGKINILPPRDHIMCMEKMIATFDENYLSQWQQLDTAYKENLSKGIVAFHFIVTEIQAQEKLSQNKSSNDRKNIVKNLSHSDDSAAKAIALRMQELFQNPNDVS